MWVLSSYTPLSLLNDIRLLNDIFKDITVLNDENSKLIPNGESINDINTEHRHDKKGFEHLPTEEIIRNIQGTKNESY